MSTIMVKVKRKTRIHNDNNELLLLWVDWIYHCWSSFLKVNIIIMVVSFIMKTMMAFKYELVGYIFVMFASKDPLRVTLYFIMTIMN